MQESEEVDVPKLKHLLRVLRNKHEQKCARVAELENILSQRLESTDLEEITTQFQSRLKRLQADLEESAERQAKLQQALTKSRNAVAYQEKIVMELAAKVGRFVKGQGSYEDTVLELGRVILQPGEKASEACKGMCQLLVDSLQQHRQKYSASARESTKARMQLMRVVQERKEQLAKLQGVRQQLEAGFARKLREAQKALQLARVDCQKQLLEKESRLRQLGEMQSVRTKLQYVKNIVRQYFGGDSSVRAMTFTALLKILQYSPQQVKSFRM